MSDVAKSAVLARLAALDVPAEYQAAIAGRPAPRFYVAVQLTLVLGAIAAAVAAYQASLQTDRPLSERKLAGMFGKTSRRWARSRMAEARQSLVPA